MHNIVGEAGKCPPINCQKGQNVPIGLNESECVSVSPRACQRMVRIEKFCYMIEIGDTDVNIVRNCKPVRNYIPRERLWSESHFRLVPSPLKLSRIL